MEWVEILRQMGLSESVLLFFSAVEDPRVEGRCDHLFLEMIFISVCAVLCGAESFSEIELFAKHRKKWFKKYLSLPGGIPTDDTFRRLFSAIDPKAFSLALTDWVQTVLVGKRSKRIVFDGKTVAGTDRRINRSSSKRLHLLNIFDAANSLAIGQIVCKSTASTEPHAILECLDFLDVEGALVSVDAVSSDEEVMARIREKDADYLCPIKKNKRNSFHLIDDKFASIASRKIKRARSKEESRGRTEEREVSLVQAKELGDELCKLWPDVKTVIQITRTRESVDTRPLIQEQGPDGKITYARNMNTTRKETSAVYYITSREMTPKEALAEIRDHWSIENKLHWSLDVAFSEDQWRARDRNAAANLSTIRKFTLNILSRAKGKGGKRAKMKVAGWDNDYLEGLIGQF